MEQFASPLSSAVDPALSRREALARLCKASAVTGLSLSGLAACGGGKGDSAAAAAQEGQSEEALAAQADRTDGLPRPATFASGLVQPWGLAFLPDGEMLVTEKAGRLRRVGSGGQLSAALNGLPDVADVDQGGLLDVAVDNRGDGEIRVFLTWTERDASGAMGVAVARGRLAGDGVRDVQVILRAGPKAAPSTSPINFGARLVVAPDDTLFVTIGDRSENNQHDVAQQLNSHLGKVLRIRQDGSAPADNPFAGERGALPEIWSIGHRNPQGAALRPGSGELWISEHGPQGGDEINFVQRGRNYGWPRISYGCDYGARPVDTCTVVGGATRAPGMEQPETWWAPISMAPSGLAFCDGRMFPEFKGNLFAGALRGRSLWRMELNGQQVASRSRLYGEMGERIRDVRQGPDGALYLLTDNRAGRILRIAR
jgi:aldose sugar dehydrogenase